MAKNHRRASCLFRGKLEPYDLTPPQFAVLAILWWQEGLSQTRLCSLGNMDRTTLSGVIDRLEKQGLVTRTGDPGDRRTCLIHLTPKGKDLEAPLTRLAGETNASISANLSPADKDQLVKLLRKMHD